MKKDTGKLHLGLADVFNKSQATFKSQFPSELLVGPLTSCLPGVQSVTELVRSSVKELADFSALFHTGLTKSLGHSVNTDFFNTKEISGEAALVKPLITNLNDIIKLPIDLEKFGRVNLVKDNFTDLELIRDNVKKALII